MLEHITFECDNCGVCFDIKVVETVEPDTGSAFLTEIVLHPICPCCMGQATVILEGSDE